MEEMFWMREADFLDRFASRWYLDMKLYMKYVYNWIWQSKSDMIYNILVVSFNVHKLYLQGKYRLSLKLIEE